MSVAELVAEVQRHPARHVVLTGGEPMIAKEIRELATELHDIGYHLTIETAATVAPAGITDPTVYATLGPLPEKPEGV